MKGFRFYAEMPEARKSKSASKANPFFPWTVAALRQRASEGYRADLVAVDLDDKGRPFYTGGSTDIQMESVSVAIEGNARSYGIGCASRGYLRTRCVRIPEALARQLSPELFRYLES